MNEYTHYQKIKELHYLDELKNTKSKAFGIDDFILCTGISCLIAIMLSFAIALIISEVIIEEQAFDISLMVLGTFFVILNGSIWIVVLRMNNQRIKDKIKAIEKETEGTSFSKNYAIDFSRGIKKIANKSEKAFEELENKLGEDKSLLDTLLKDIENETFVVTGDDQKDDDMKQWVFYNAERLGKKNNCKQEEKAKAKRSRSILQGNMENNNKVEVHSIQIEEQI